jgi:hypothetical protein
MTYAAGLHDLDVIDENVTSVSQGILTSIPALESQCEQLLQMIRTLEDSKELQGGEETATRRQYVCRKETIIKKITDIRKSLDVVKIMLQS